MNIVKDTHVQILHVKTRKFQMKVFANIAQVNRPFFSNSFRDFLFVKSRKILNLEVEVVDCFIGGVTKRRFRREL